MKLVYTIFFIATSQMCASHFL